jgi:ribosomal protein S18 acetylase RimI-like enzyme
MVINVRKIQPSDKPSWQQLFFDYLKFYETSPSDVNTDLAWERITSPDPEIQGLVAESNGEVVGIVHFHYQLSTWTDTFDCYLEDLYVAEEARGNGAARALIQAVKELSTVRKCSKLFWITKESNTTARKLYDKVATLGDFIRYEVKL